MNTIKEKRIALGMSQGELANKLGVSRVNISHWENGTTMPRTSKLTTLAEVLQCSVDDLLCKKE